MSESAILSLHTVDYPFETLIQRAKSNPRKLILDPDFQRKYKWDKEGWARASKFIESCLMRIPLPSCYFAERDDRAHLVIDGVQRITTVMKFMDNEFALEGMTAFPELEGKKFSELGNLSADLESTTIRCIILRNENPKQLVAEIFARLNRGAVELSDQEIRHALFAGEFDGLLNDLASIQEIRDFGKGRDGEAKRDSRESEELVLRFFAFDELSQEYDGNLARFLDKYMEKAAGYDEVKLSELRERYMSSLAACKTIFSEEEIFSDINKARGRQGVVYYDLLMSTLGKVPLDSLAGHRDKIRDAFSEMCRSEEFRRMTAGGLQRKSSINKRNQLWSEKLQEAIK